MPFNEIHIARLLFRHFSGELSPGEKDEFEQWRNANPENRQLVDKLADEKQFASAFETFLRIEPATRRREQGAAVRREPVAVWRWQAKKRSFALALTAVFISVTLVLWENVFNHSARPAAHSPLAPPGHYAGLRLEDGSSVDLGSHKPGFIRMMGTMAISKTSDSTVTFLPASGFVEEHVFFDRPSVNLLRTGPGERFDALLSDSTRIQLNAASAIRFPTRFDSIKRAVYLQGEGYFDVRPSAETAGTRLRAPFVVYVPNPGRSKGETDSLLAVTCLGTKFDIRAYPEENQIRIILEEGKLRLDIGGRMLILSAGQTAVLQEGEVLRIDSTAWAAGTTWRNEQFVFDDQRLDPILRELSRWYDYKLVYSQNQPATLYYLNGLRDQPLDAVLRCLGDQGGFNYHIHSDTVFVSR